MSGAQELEDWGTEADAWFVENKPGPQDFMLPLTFMEVGTDEQFEFLRNWQRKVYEAGYLGAAWPREYGGGGLTQAHQDIATNAMRKHKTPIIFNTIGLGWAGPLLLEMGMEEHKKKYIPGILSAEDVWCQGFSEPDNGSDLGNAQLKAVKDGDEYVLNGSKIWTTHGHYAKYMILLARTNPDAPNKYAGLSFFLAPMKIPGVETVKIRKLTGEHGFTQTFFTDARIPADGLMGKEGDGWMIAMKTLMYERNAKGGQAGGIAITEVDPLEILKLARKAERNGKPVLDDPVIRDKLVEFIMEAQSFKLGLQRQKNMPLVQERPMAIPLLNKLMMTEYMREINDFALSLQGTKAGYYMDEPNAVDDGYWQRGYLNAFSATIGGGTSQIQHNIVGEHVLGLPKTR